MKDVVKVYTNLIEEAIRQTKFGAAPPSLYEPIRYIMSLGGKRLRPVLVLMAYRLYRRDFRKILSYAAAVEAFHNFTLMHDDIMDNAPLRRGKATVHTKWNTSTAILSGDVMLVKVYEMFSPLPPLTYQNVLKEFNRCAAEVCEGQQWDMEFEKASVVSERQYINMIRQKTAVLLGFSLQVGGLLAGASRKEIAVLNDIGTLLGLGFQLKDDLLDAYADPKKFGKQVGGDILANKKTYLWIKAMDKASPATRKEMATWIRAKPGRKKIEGVKAVYDRLDIPRLTQRKVNAYFSRALSLLSTLPDTAGKKDLTTYIEALTDRQH